LFLLFQGYSTPLKAWAIFVCYRSFLFLWLWSWTWFSWQCGNNRLVFSNFHTFYIGNYYCKKYSILGFSVSGLGFTSHLSHIGNCYHVIILVAGFSRYSLMEFGSCVALHAELLLVVVTLHEIAIYSSIVSIYFSF
jgi:hypothetical protein